MDFFSSQIQARKKTRWLVVLFLLAVLAIILAIHLLAVASLGSPVFNPAVFFVVASVVILFVGSGSVWKISRLASGGGVDVALALGGTPVLRDTDRFLEQRLLNVVDEMAIASGIRVPQVFILREESAINAFAAGMTPNTAVIAVTRGCLEKLDRDELQGVIAHEFSHIFNGDMRLNMHLIGVLHGILLIALFGRMLMRLGFSMDPGRDGSQRSGRRGRGDIRLALFGLAFFILGYIGIFFGNLIKAAVSRQREYLADASAVQYTRNPAGIAGALKKIAGVHSTRLNAARADEASHMLFGQGVSFWLDLFATHPPIDERISRIDPSWKPESRNKKKKYSRHPLDRPAEEAALGAFVGIATNHASASTKTITPAQVCETVGTLDRQHIEQARALLGHLPEGVEALIHDPEQAPALVYGLLVVHASDPAAMLGEHVTDAAMRARVLEQLDWLQPRRREIWLQLVDLALPAIRELPATKREEVFAIAGKLAQADKRLNLFEFALLAILHQQIIDKRPAIKRYRSSTRLRNDISRLLSWLAHAGHADEESAQMAFAAATTRAPMDGPWVMAARGSLNARSLEGVLLRLGTTQYAFKARLLEACAASVMADGVVTRTEAELLRAISALLECPLPPFLNGQHNMAGADQGKQGLA